MLIVITALFVVILFALPFLPGIVEWIRKRDAEPLFISMEYIRYPRYFGKSFRKILINATSGSPTHPGMCTLKLSKEEKVEVTDTVHFGENLAIDHLIYAIGDLTSADRVLFNKEVYVTGNAVIGRDNVIQAMAGDGDITVGEGTKFRRWLDAEGSIHAGKNCRLGISASSGDKLFIEKDCVFRRLFGMPVVTGQAEPGAGNENAGPVFPKRLLSNGLTFVTVKEEFISPGSVMEEDVVFLNDVRIGAGARFKGSIKSHGSLTMEEGVVVEGNIFSDGDIAIGKNSRIFGHVFSQMTVRIGSQTVISGANRIKTVVGKKVVLLSPGVTIYGFVTTEGEGRTIA
jgi:acyl-[acyl carrier protein]--UDP-N-acetylglucosamine O-acyltransferase